MHTPHHHTSCMCPPLPHTTPSMLCKVDSTSTHTSHHAVRKTTQPLLGCGGVGIICCVCEGGGGTILSSTACCVHVCGYVLCERENLYISVYTQSDMYAIAIHTCDMKTTQIHNMHHPPLPHHPNTKYTTPSSPLPHHPPQYTIHPIIPLSHHAQLPRQLPDPPQAPTPLPLMHPTTHARAAQHRLVGWVHASCYPHTTAVRRATRQVCVRGALGGVGRLL